MRMSVVLVLWACLAAAGTAAAAAVEPGAGRIAPAGFAAVAEPSLLELRATAGPAAAAAAPAPHAAATLGGARARILLRSLTLPGWGQATLGHRRSAAFFGLTETAVWGTFTAFRIQVAMREDAFLRTARLLAGIDLSGRDEEWRRIVGGFASSDEYNRLVVVRDAANLYYDDPEAYRAYIAAHSLTGAERYGPANSSAGSITESAAIPVASTPSGAIMASTGASVRAKRPKTPTSRAITNGAAMMTPRFERRRSATSPAPPSVRRCAWCPDGAQPRSRAQGQPRRRRWCRRRCRRCSPPRRPRWRRCWSRRWR